MANDKLKKYLEEVAQHAPTRQAHLTDPEASMKKAKLSKKHRDMIMNGDVEGVKKELGMKSVMLLVTSTSPNKGGLRAKK